jgi:hypothetical protein
MVMVMLIVMVMTIAGAAAAAEVGPEGAEDGGAAYGFARAVGGPEELFVLGGDFGGVKERLLGLGLWLGLWL